MSSYFSLFIFLYVVNISDKSIYLEHKIQRLDNIKSGIYNEPSATIANPIVAFKLVKRLKSEWMNVVNSNEAEENINALREGYRRMEGSLPKLEDLQGAAQGLMRLQDVYHLRRITDGNAIDIYKPPVSDTLSGVDCFLVGKVGHTVLSVRLFRGTEWSPENEGTLEEALDHLAFSHFKVCFLSYSITVQFQSCILEPMNSRVHFNVEKYEKLLDESPPVTNQSLDLKRPDSTYLRTRNVYEKLCQTKGSQVSFHTMLRSLHCHSEVISRIILWQMSESLRFNRFVQTADSFRNKLSSVEAGGFTAFIYANFSVPVVENSVLFWWNLHRNGQENVDTFHADCPVIVGDKWVANKWVHEYGQEFQRRCSLNPEE
uniref:Prolyl 4-hydroxylase subunit alpha 3 n=1 Tax=Sinocyclocheilus grahami TaxID=75366 RepID=A0A672RW12_SINGR